ncbi:MAG TPA: hypothetical protein VIQ31_36740 [Phormidium sp.]
MDWDCWNNSEDFGESEFDVPDYELGANITFDSVTPLLISDKVDPALLEYIHANNLEVHQGI